MKAEILKRLKEAGDHVSGQELCEALSVSRTAVWKVIRQLQDEGYVIEAVRNRGYRLLSSRDILSGAELAGCIECRELGQNPVYLKEVDSTNIMARKLAEEDAPHGTVVVADTQSAGKGRRGRGWVSPPGTGIWMSLVLRPPVLPRHASALTLVAAMAVQKALSEIPGVGAEIKWPNDVVVNGKKVCGILTEMSSELDDIRYVVTGIGINVNQDLFPPEIAGKATSLKLETGVEVGRALLIGRVLRHFESYYELFLQTSDMALLKDEYMGAMVNRNREVSVLEFSGTWNGVATGINCDGELMVMTADGTVQTVCSGEVSVRGVYGYT